MRKQSAAPDFTGQTVFVGMDVHLKQWTLTFRAGGLELKRFSAPPDPETLVRHLHANYPGAEYRTAYEAGFCGFWIHRRLEALGVNSLVAHAPDIPTTHKERTNKDDRRDSRKLARELEANTLRPLYVPDPVMEELRGLFRARDRLAADARRSMNRIKSLFHFAGIELPLNSEMKHWSNRFLAWIEDRASGDTPREETIRMWLGILRGQRRQLSDLTRTLRAHVRRHGDPELVTLLTTIPGVGYITAVTLYCEIIDIDRFPDADSLAAYVGLIPSTHSSDDKPQPGELTKRANRHLRGAIIEAAWIAARKDPELLLAFIKLTGRMRKTDAVIRIARRLLNRVRRVWKRRTPYVMAVTGKAPK